MNIEIRSDIPCPAGRRAGKWADIGIKMKPGDSVFIETEKDAAALLKTMRRHGVKMCRRAEAAGYRVWRLE